MARKPKHANIMLDYIYEGRVIRTEDHYIGRTSELMRFLSSINANSKFNTNIHTTDGIIKIEHRVVDLEDVVVIINKPAQSGYFHWVTPVKSVS